jgi:hypothetical protein
MAFGYGSGDFALKVVASRRIDRWGLNEWEASEGRAILACVDRDQSSITQTQTAPQDFEKSVVRCEEWSVEREMRWLGDVAEAFIRTPVGRWSPFGKVCLVVVYHPVSRSPSPYYSGICLYRFTYHNTETAWTEGGFGTLSSRWEWAAFCKTLLVCPSSRRSTWECAIYNGSHCNPLFRTANWM